MGETNNRPFLTTVGRMVSSTLKNYGNARNVSSSLYIPLVAMSCKYSLNASHGIIHGRFLA